MNAAGCVGAAMLAMSIGVVTPLHAAMPALSDGPEGMTCAYYVAAARLPWQRPGGDWRDADGELHGARAFSSADIGSGDQLRPVQWDVTALARRWVEGTQPAGAVLLHADSSDARSGIVNLRSREQPESSTRPVLVVVWEDGRSQRLQPVADTHFACPTHKSTGASRVIKVGGERAALLVFPWPAAENGKLRSAHLEMTVERTYGRGLTIGTFQPVLPWAAPAKAQAGLARGFRRDVGIEKHPDVLFADRFERGRDAAAWSGSAMDDSHTVGEDAAEGFRPFDGRALKVTIERDSHQGLNSHYRFARRGQAEPEEAFVRYYLRLGESWNPTRDGGKLPGLSGTYGRGGWGMRPSDGRNGWSARGAFFRQPPAGDANAALRGIGSYVYHADLDGPSGTTWGWGLGTSGLLQKNRWYSVEQQVRLNQPGQSDGELRAWIDGVLVFEKTGLRFRDVPELRIESLWMNVYHGGTAKAAEDMVLFIDNVVVARRYIGPAGDGP